jgi:DNA-binding transcriptional MerR regulator
MYTVKEVAKLLDLTEHTVRFYTDKGLVPSLQRDKNNKRIFDEDAINWLRGAKKLKRCGMSVEDIKKYVDLSLEGHPTIDERYEMIRKQKELVLAQLEELKLMAEYITNKEKHYRDIKNQVIADDTNPAHWQNGNSVNSSCSLQKDKMSISH